MVHTPDYLENKLDLLDCSLAVPLVNKLDLMVNNLVRLVYKLDSTVNTWYSLVNKLTNLVNTLDLLVNN